MSLQIVADFKVEQTTSELLPVPRYSVRGPTVALGPYEGRDAHETFLRETFGSTDWLWAGGDEFRFSKNDKVLRGLMLATPEVNPEAGWEPQLWLTAPPVYGSLMADINTALDASQASTRWVSADGEYMVCAYQSRPPISSDLLRLRVAEYFDLVFSDGLLSGWVLQHPARFLVNNWEFPPSSDCHPELNKILHDHLALLSEPAIDAIQDQDPSIYAALRSLKQRVSLLPRDPRCDVIMHHIDELLEDWYS